MHLLLKPLRLLHLLFNLLLKPSHRRKKQLLKHQRKKQLLKHRRKKQLLKHQRKKQLLKHRRKNNFQNMG
jgi:hypothetical protein